MERRLTMADLKFPYDMEDSTLKMILKMWSISPRSIKRQEKKVEKRLKNVTPEMAYFTKSEEIWKREIMMYAVDDLVCARFRQATMTIAVLAITGIISVFVVLTTIGPTLFIIWLCISLIIILIGRNVFRSSLDYFKEYPTFSNERVFERVCSSVAEKYHVDIWFPHF